MSRWGIPFDHIENNWTDAQFMVMVTAARRNSEAERDAARPAPKQSVSMAGRAHLLKMIPENCRSLVAWREA